jgi:hypothetical protein
VLSVWTAHIAGCGRASPLLGRATGYLGVIAHHGPGIGL